MRFGTAVFKNVGIAALTAMLVLCAPSRAEQYTYFELNPTDFRTGQTIADYALIVYDDTANRFSAEISFIKSAVDAEGFAVAVSPSYMPDETGSVALLYFDASGSGTPKLTAYAYNTQGNNDSCGNSPGSWQVGNAGSGQADPILSHLTAPLLSTTNTDGGTRRTLGFSIDTTTINGHSPVYPGATKPWTGVEFGTKIGLWLWGVEFSSPPTYDAGGYLTSWPNDDCVFYDFSDKDANTAPTCSGLSGTHTIAPGDTFTGTMAITDANNDQIFLSLTGVPSGATTTTSGGLFVPPLDVGFSYTPTIDEVGDSSTVTVRVEDPYGGVALCPFTLQVQPNLSPVCAITSSLEGLACQGSLTSISIDGSGSNDPEGAELTYTWSTNCSGGVITDSSTPTATLELTDPGDGKEVVCTANLVVSDGNSSDSCSATVGVNACPLDCEGVPFGSLVTDRCGVCGGDGFSCISCVEEDVADLKISLDGGTENLARLADSLAANFRRANNGELSKSIARLVKQAHKMHMVAWQVIDDFPSLVTTCDTSPFCVDNRTQSEAIASYQECSALIFSYLRRISKRTRKLLRNRGLMISNYNARRRRFMRKARAQRTANQVRSEQLPARSSSCPIGLE